MPMFQVERNWIELVGRGWYGQTAAMRRDVDSYDIKNIGELTRENVERWIDSHCGDFQKVDDFAAYIKDFRSDFQTEDGEIAFNDCMYPSEDE